MAEPSDRDDPPALSLTPISTASSRSGSDHLAASMVVSSPPSSTDGRHPALRFSLRILNNGGETAQLANPYEGLTVEVADEQGRPVALRPPPRAAKTGRWDKALEARERYVRLEALTVGVEQQSAEQARAERFSLDVDSALQLDLAIESVRTAPDSTESCPVGTGPYLLRVVLPLAWDDAAGQHDLILRSDPPTPVVAS